MYHVQNAVFMDKWLDQEIKFQYGSHGSESLNLNFIPIGLSFKMHHKDVPYKDTDD
jgi:hypothetical protein